MLRQGRIGDRCRSSRFDSGVLSQLEPRFGDVQYFISPPDFLSANAAISRARSK
jgi:hypothetical protein